MKRIVIISISILLFVFALFTGCTNKKEYIGIVSALDKEIQLILDEAEIIRTDSFGGVDYHIGSINGQNVIITKAGVGKIRSSSAVTALLNNYNISKVIFTGIAGGLLDEEKVLDVVIATSLVEHDYGRLENTGFVWAAGDPGIVTSKGDYYECDKDLVDIAYLNAIEIVGEDNVFKGVIASGDQFVANEKYVETLRRDFDAYACEMEGASIAIVCANYNVPVVIIRTLSDKADGSAHENYVNFGNEAGEQSSKIVLKIIKSLNK